MSTSDGKVWLVGMDGGWGCRGALAWPPWMGQGTGCRMAVPEANLKGFSLSQGWG